MAYYRCGPTAIGSRTSWGPVSSPVEKPFDRPLSGNFDRIFNAFERTNAFEYVRAGKAEERHIGHGDIVVKSMSSSFERADCALAAQTPVLEDEEFYREKILYSQARQLFPLQEDLADWINKTIGITYLTGENFLDVLDNGAELCQLAAVIQEKARDALDRGLIVGPIPIMRGRWWQRAARRSFFSRDNTEMFLTFCRDLGVHENLLFESDDLVVHNQPRQVIVCLLEVSRLAARYDIEPPGLVQLETEIAREEQEASAAAWHFTHDTRSQISPEPPSSPGPDDAVEPAGAAKAKAEAEAEAEAEADAASTRSDHSTDSDEPLKPATDLDKRVVLVSRLLERGCRCGAGAGRCSRLLKVRKLGEGRYNIAGRNVFIRLLKGRHMMVRVGGGWDTLEHFLSRHEPCQVRLVAQGRPRRLPLPAPAPAAPATPSPATTPRTRTPVARTDSRASSTASDGKVSPVTVTKTPTDTKTPKVSRTRANLSLPLDGTARRKSVASAGSSSTPSTPSTPPAHLRKSLTTNCLAAAAKKSRSMSVTTRGKRTPVTPPEGTPRTARSQSLVEAPARPRRPSTVTVVSGVSAADIEASVRQSLAAALHEHDKPFLHIKAKYRSPPPREVPPR